MHCECNPKNMRNFEDIKIAVAGTGYVGLSIATLLSQFHKVTAVDVIPEKVEKINNRIGNNTMRFFPDLTAFQQVYPDGNFIDWKIYQSVAAELYAHDLERLC